MEDKVRNQVKMVMNGAQFCFCFFLPEKMAKNFSDRTAGSIEKIPENEAAPSGQDERERNQRSRLSRRCRNQGNVLCNGWQLIVKRPERARRIFFLDTIDSGRERMWDVSEKRDGSVMAWTVENDGVTELYIGGDGGVTAPADSGCLFSGLKEAEEISFQGNFDTFRAESMKKMFFKCRRLKKLDLRGFDTSRATDMSWMFSQCQKLEELDVSSFDTSRVLNMSEMFEHCERLEALDVSSFQTSQVKYMTEMFRGCSRLYSLDIRHFDLSHVVSPTPSSLFDYFMRQDYYATPTRDSLLPRHLRKRK